MNPLKTQGEGDSLLGKNRTMSRIPWKKKKSNAFECALHCITALLKPPGDFIPLLRKRAGLIFDGGEKRARSLPGPGA